MCRRRRLSAPAPAPAPVFEVLLLIISLSCTRRADPRRAAPDEELSQWDRYQSLVRKATHCETVVPTHRHSHSDTPLSGYYSHGDTRTRVLFDLFIFSRSRGWFWFRVLVTHVTEAADGVCFSTTVFDYATDQAAQNERGIAGVQGTAVASQDQGRVRGLYLHEYRGRFATRFAD